MARKRLAERDELYPRLFIEALAYHESGHAVMAVLLGLPIAQIAIGPACDEPDFNGRVYLDLAACPQQCPVFKHGLLEVASEQAEKLFPRQGELRTIHKKHPHLKPFNLGLKADLDRGFEAVSVVYVILGLAKSTAKRKFKAEYCDEAARLIDLNAPAVHRLADRLMRNNQLNGADATSVILAEGPLNHNGLFRRFGYPDPDMADCA